MAFSFGNCDAAKLLVANKADLDLKSNDRKTPLDIAEQRGKSVPLYRERMLQIARLFSRAASLSLGTST
jgi:ankyrin repeat protein